MSIKIYFAGPNVFHLRAKEIEREIEAYCKTVDVIPLIPGDSGIDWSASPDKIANDIFEINVDHLKNCDAIVANVSPFRGACIDDGTAWEIGFAYALNKPIATYSSTDKRTGEIIIEQSGLSKEHNSPRRDKDNFLIEEFGFHSNLMIACSTKHFPYTFDCYTNIVTAIKEPIAYLKKMLG